MFQLLSVFDFSFRIFSLFHFCFALLHLKISTCVCRLTRRHFLRSQFIAFTHNLRKLIGKRREMKTFTMSHKAQPVHIMAILRFVAHSTRLFHALRKAHIHTPKHERRQSCICSADDKNNINLLLHKFEFDFKYGCAEFKWNIFRPKMSNMFRSVRNIFNVHLCSSCICIHTQHTI